MFYFLVEIQATCELYDKSGKPTIVPALRTAEFSAGQEAVPVFLSKRHAYLYMKSNKLDQEFKLASTNDYTMAYYRNIAEAAKEKAPWQFMIVIALAQQAKLLDIRLWDKAVSLYDLFFNEQAIRQELAEIFGDHYQSIVDDEQLSDEEIIKKSDQFLATLNPTSSNLLSTLYNKVKTIIINNKDSKKIDITAQEEKNLFDVEYGHLYILKAPDNSFYSHLQDSRHKILLFVNKLDALIFTLIEKEISGDSYEVVNFTNDTILKSHFKRGYEQGQCVFNVCLGFMGIRTPLGPKWATENETLRGAGLLAAEYPLTEIENGFDLKDYFAYVVDDKERKTSLIGLVNTNHTATNTLMDGAKKFFADMKANIVHIAKDEPLVYPRLLFYAA